MGIPDIRQAALLPFVETPQGRQYWLVLPVAKRPDLPPPEWQICKGGRDGGESLQANALREGREELGLPGNIGEDALIDLGVHDFLSVDGKTIKPTQVYAVRLPMLIEAISNEPAIAQTRWLTLKEFQREGREDQRALLASLDARLGR
jgi:8-oxo-dGTP pyrophosphatase MutT (NUDIX family)